MKKSVLMSIAAVGVLALGGVAAFAVNGNVLPEVVAADTEYSVTVDKDNPFVLDSTLNQYYVKLASGYRVYFAEHQSGFTIVTDSTELQSGVIKNTSAGEGIYFDHGKATVIGDDSKTYYQGFASCTGLKVTWASSAVGAVVDAYNGDGTWSPESASTNSTRLTSTGSTRFWWHMAGASGAYITSVVFYYTGC